MSQSIKLFVSPEVLRQKSFELASIVVKAGFKPDVMVVLWRGGASIGCYMHEFFKYIGWDVDHIAIRTSRYTGIDKASSGVAVHNLGYLKERLNKDSKVLLVDDVHDTGLSIDAVYVALMTMLKENYPTDIRTATVYYKPLKNQTKRVPNYYVEQTNAWIVFPHELEGLTMEEIVPIFGEKVWNMLCEAKKN